MSSRPGFRLELYDILQSILSIDGDVSELSDHEARILKVIFNMCRLLHMPVPVVHREGIKLPKINTPMFDGDIKGLAKVLRTIQYSSQFKNPTHWYREASLSKAGAEGSPSPERH